MVDGPKELKDPEQDRAAGREKKKRTKLACWTRALTFTEVLTIGREISLIYIDGSQYISKVDCLCLSHGSTLNNSNTETKYS